MILFSLGTSFVVGLDIFHTNVQSTGIDSTIEARAKAIAAGDISAIAALGIFSVAGLIIVLGYAYRTGSWNIVGAYLFGVLFWGSWGSTLSVLSLGGFFNNSYLTSFLLLITVAMTFIFAGAVIGILGGKD